MRTKWLGRPQNFLPTPDATRAASGGKFGLRFPKASHTDGVS
jgi:hypothetical protein